MLSTDRACTACTAHLDGPGRQVTVRIVLDELAAVSSRDGGGTIGHGAELTSFAARSYRMNTSREHWTDPGPASSSGADTTQIDDSTYRIP